MEKELERLHRELGLIHAEICEALVKRRLRGGSATLRTWEAGLRREADRIHEMGSEIASGNKGLQES